MRLHTEEDLGRLSRLGGKKLRKAETGANSPREEDDDEGDFEGGSSDENITES
jgi:hypothetical protein